jgi:hypothetical protein
VEDDSTVMKIAKSTLIALLKMHHYRDDFNTICNILKNLAKSTNWRLRELAITDNSVKKNYTHILLA